MIVIKFELSLCLTFSAFLCNSFFLHFCVFFDLCHYVENIFHITARERGGSLIERRTPERDIGGGGFETYLRLVVSLNKKLYSPKVLVILKKRMFRPNMTENC